MVTGVTDYEGATRAPAFFADEAGVREFESKFERYGPFMSGLNDGQSETPTMMAKNLKDHFFGDQITEVSLVEDISDSSYVHPAVTAA